MLSEMYEDQQRLQTTLEITGVSTGKRRMRIEDEDSETKEPEEGESSQLQEGAAGQGRT